MKIGLHDAELDYMPKKSFPNLALMKISTYHKSLGDTEYLHCKAKADEYTESMRESELKTNELQSKIRKEFE